MLFYHKTQKTGLIYSYKTKIFTLQIRFCGIVLVCKCKRRVLINTSRAKLVNKESLIDFMKNHKDFIYCSDLLYDESNFDNNLDLVTLPNLFYTPHIGFFTKEAMENRAKIIFDYLFDYLDIDK